MKNNLKQIPRVILQAVIAPLTDPPGAGLFPTADGVGVRITGPGGICTNVKPGDPVFDMCGFHIIPGAALKSPCGSDGALAVYANPGTEIYLAGERKPCGYVLGRCSAAGDGVIAAAFENERLENFTGEERFVIYCQSCGFKFSDYPQIHCFIDPYLVNRIPTREENSRLLFPVSKILPDCLAGRLGSDMLSIMSKDSDTFAQFDLKNLRFGDFVLFRNIDACYGTAFMENAVTIGIVTDGDAPHTGGGPAVAPIFSCQGNMLDGYVSKDWGNISAYFDLKKGKKQNAEN